MTQAPSSMSPFFQAQTVAHLSSVNGRTSPNPAAGAEVVSYFLDCLGIFIQRAVEDALSKNQSVAHPNSTNLVGGMQLAQEVTGLSKARLYTLVSVRGIPHAKRGNKLYFNRAELEAWIADGKRGENKKAH